MKSFLLLTVLIPIFASLSAYAEPYDEGSFLVVLWNKETGEMLIAPADGAKVCGKPLALDETIPRWSNSPFGDKSFSAHQRLFYDQKGPFQTPEEFFAAQEGFVGGGAIVGRQNMIATTRSRAFNDHLIGSYGDGLMPSSLQGDFHQALADHFIKPVTPSVPDGRSGWIPNDDLYVKPFASLNCAKTPGVVPRGAPNRCACPGGLKGKISGAGVVGAGFAYMSYDIKSEHYLESNANTVFGPRVDAVIETGLDTVTLGQFSSTGQGAPVLDGAAPSEMFPHIKYNYNSCGRWAPESVEEAAHGAAEGPLSAIEWFSKKIHKTLDPVGYNTPRKHYGSSNPTRGGWTRTRK